MSKILKIIITIIVLLLIVCLLSLVAGLIEIKLSPLNITTDFDKDNFTKLGVLLAALFGFFQIIKYFINVFTGMPLVATSYTPELSNDTIVVTTVITNRLKKDIIIKDFTCSGFTITPNFKVEDEKVLSKKSKSLKWKFVKSEDIYFKKNFLGYCFALLYYSSVDSTKSKQIKVKLKLKI